MRKILVLTDSLGLPRDLPEEVLYEESWPCLLSKGFRILQSSIGGGTSYDIYKQAAYLKVYNPDVLVIQVGIVDCAPRTLSYHENIIGNYFWLSRKILNFIIPKIGNYIRNFRKISYCSEADFRENLNAIKNFFPKSKFIILGILPACREYELSLPTITSKINSYNNILECIFKNDYLSLDEIEQNCIMNDFHHLNKNGHLFVYDMISERLRILF